MSKRLRLAVLISGGGSNLQAIIDAIENGSLNASIELVVSNVTDAYGLTRASTHGLRSLVIDHRDYDSRARFDAELSQQLETVNVDYILLAGYMRILSAAFVGAFEHRILNIHPALLPAYKGLNTHQRALDNHESRHGVTIHLVTAELDDGPILLQGSYAIDDGDTASDLQARGQRLEHQMYPQVLRWLSEGKLLIDDNGRIHNETQPLDKPIQFST